VVDRCPFRQWPEADAGEVVREIDQIVVELLE
jgi:hypothetical protein